GCIRYVHFLLSVGSNPHNVSYGSVLDMPTLHGFAYALLGHVVAGKVLILIVAVCSISLILFTAIRWNRSERACESADVVFAAAVVVSLMTGLHMFTHDFSPLMLALLISMRHLSMSTDRHWVSRMLILLFFVPPVYFSLVATHRMFLMFPMMAAL